ncbi:MAG: chemotaxis protein CheB [Alcanivoracaceae bacterium]|nr:chemotaxis protein CheB [Alcanivoracaceae bacterium]
MSHAGIRAVVIGASWGGVNASIKVLSALDSSFPVPLFLAQHQRYESESRLARVLETRTQMRVVAPEDKEPVLPGVIYVSPPGYHMMVDGNATIALSCHWPVHYSRPSIDELFFSAGHVYGGGLLAVLLTGANEDGAEGIRYIHQRGGITIAQDPATAEAPVMPESAIRTGCVDYILPLDEIGPFLREQVSSRRK